MHARQEWWVVPGRPRWRWADALLGEDGRWRVAVRNADHTVREVIYGFSPEEARYRALEWIDKYIDSARYL